MYEYERQREMLNMYHQSPEQQQPFHQFISEPADPFCRVTCHVHVEPIRLPEPIVFPVIMSPVFELERPVRLQTRALSFQCMRHGMYGCSDCC